MDIDSLAQRIAHHPAKIKAVLGSLQRHSSERGFKSFQKALESNPVDGDSFRDLLTGIALPNRELTAIAPMCHAKELSPRRLFDTVDQMISRYGT
jgi:hypothetical protein